MTAIPEHLTPHVTDRGFTHLEPIPVWSGYNFTAAPMDFDNLAPREVGEASAYESSDAVFPSVWLRIAVDDPAYGPSGRAFDEAVMLTVDNARKLGEQLVALADNHYSKTID
jgi:hypothetical protein